MEYLVTNLGPSQLELIELDILTVALVAAAYCILHLAVAIVNGIICSTHGVNKVLLSDPQN